MEDSFSFNPRGGRQRMSRERSRSPMYKSRSPSPREWKRSERQHLDRDRDFMRDRGGRDSKVRLFVSNIPYDMRWQDLKDLFREKVGSEVSYVELYEEPNGKSTGSGVVEVKGKDLAQKAIEVLHRYEIHGRFMIVREEREKDRIRFQRPADNARDLDRGGPSSVAAVQDLMGGAMGVMNMASNVMGGSMNINSSSLNMQLLNQLGIDPSAITNQVFVANVDYRANKQKVEEIFKIAGNVIECDLKTDKDGRSRGMCTVRYEHPMEAVQSIALFNQQMLFDRPIAVRMDKWIDPILQDIPTRMPTGLKSLGVGFGAGGLPLLNIGQISNTLALSAITGQLSLQMNNVGSLGASLMGLGGSGILGAAGGNVSANAGILGGGGSSGILSGLSTNVLDSLGNNSMYPSGRSRSMDRGGPGIGSVMDERGGRMESRMSSGGNMYGPSGGGGSRMSYDRELEFERSHMASMDYDRGDRGGGDSYGRSDTSAIFVKNLPFSYSWQTLMDRFKNCGDVRTAMIKMDNGQSRGMGTVSFYNPDDARRAVHLMNGVRIEGRPIEVRLDRM